MPAEHTDEAPALDQETRERLLRQWREAEEARARALDAEACDTCEDEDEL